MKQVALEFYSGINRNSGGQLLQFLNRLPDGDVVLLMLIGSDGGNNNWARSAFSALASLPTRIRLTTCASGTVESSAVTVFCAARQRASLPHTRFLLHQATWKLNEEVDLRRAKEIVEILQSDDLAHAIAISGAIGKPLNQIQTTIEAGAAWMAPEALTQGLVQEIVPMLPPLLEGRSVERIINVTD